jgi:type I restriction enzyme M protein
VPSELFKPLRENYSAFNEQVNRLLCKWKEAKTPALKAFDKNGRPTVLIEAIAEDLLSEFRKAPLLDAYDVYQHLMD